MQVAFATQMTLLRIALAPIIMSVLLWGGGAAPWSWVAAVLLAIAGATDWLDGFLARRHKSVSHMGAALDLMADKILVAVVLLALVQLSLLPAWWAAIVISREMAVSGLRAYSASHGTAIPTGRWGKGKTALTFVALLVRLLRQDLISDVLLGLALVLTVYSGAAYLYQGWRRLGS